MELRIEEGADFARTMRALKAFDADLAKATRKRISTAAKPVVADVRKKVLSAPTTGRQRTGLRKNIARGVTLKVNASANPRFAQGVSIRATSRALPANQKGMARTYNQPTFRRRVFGTDTWVVQAGYPYFYGPIAAHRAAFRRAVADALTDATNKLGSAS